MSTPTLRKSIANLGKWFERAKTPALAAYNSSRPLANSPGASERHLAALHYELLRPMLGAAYTKVFSGEILEPWGNVRPPKCSLTNDQEGACLSIGVNYRTVYASNARVSAYGFGVDPVAIFLADVLQLVEVPEGLIKQLEEHGARFFTEMIDLYFSIFGRSNTLNEFFLDTHKRRASPTSTGADSTVVFSVEYRPTATGALHHSAGASDPAPPLKVVQTGDSLGIIVSQSVADALIGRVFEDPFRSLFGGGYAEAPDLSAEFWGNAWQTYCESIEDAANLQHRSRCSTDWVPAALRRMSTRFAPKQRSLVERLTLAREVAERRLLCNGAAIGQEVLALYPDTIPVSGDDADETSPQTEYALTEKIRRLLRMLQGNLCLVPWARKSGRPLPIVILPVIGDYSIQSAQISLACSWTFVLANHVAVVPKMWLPVWHSAEDLFQRMCVPPPAVRPDPVASWPWKTDIPGHVEALSKDFLACDSNRRKFISLVETCKLLTGVTHESHPVSFTFIYGDPEILKGIDYAVSNETSRFSGTPVDLPGVSEEDDGIPKDAIQLRLQCDGHYAIFQRPGIAGYIDRVHGNECFMDKIVSLRSPSDLQIAHLRARGVLEDEFLLIRALTSQYPSNAVGLVAGGDGRLRLFVDGKMTLVWRKDVPPDEKHWKIGLEFSRTIASSQQESRLDKLRRHISSALAVSTDNGIINDIVATICTISETPGEGALIIFDPRDEEEPALCDMVPDDFKMEWARTRRLNGLEQRLLRSLMTMDGAIHISKFPKAHMVRARRFIAASPQAEFRDQYCCGVNPSCPARPASKSITLCKTGPFDATCLVSYFKMWESVAHCAEKGTNFDQNPVTNPLLISRQREQAMQSKRAMRKWQHRIGAKGTRHRSVFQFVVLLEQRLGTSDIGLAPLLCSISADGPVNLYCLEQCIYRKNGACALSCDTKGKGNCVYLWTDEVIE